MYKPKRTFKKVKIKNLYIGNGVTLDDEGIPRHGCRGCGSHFSIWSNEELCSYCKQVEDNKNKYMRR